MSGFVEAFEMDGTNPRFETLAIEALLDREKDVVPDSILYTCAHLASLNPTK
jgi:hypothetical protein